MVYQVPKEAGFDEVFDSQRIFKVLMDSMGRPGKICRLEQHKFSKAPDSFNPYVLSILKVLGGDTVSFSLFKGAPEDWKIYLSCNARRINSEPESADFAVFQGEFYDEGFQQLKTGSLEYPEDSATAIISVQQLLTDSASHKSGSANQSLNRTATLGIQVKGPGVQATNCFCVNGLDHRYLTIRPEINASFPLGIDAVLIDECGNVVSLPRTSRTEVKEYGI